MTIPFEKAAPAGKMNSRIGRFLTRGGPANRRTSLFPVALLLLVLTLPLLGGCSGYSGAGENSVLHYFQRGNEAFVAEDYRRAIIHYRNALALEPGAPDLHYNLGLAYYRAGNYRSAVRSYLNAIKLDANFPSAHHNLALAYNKLYKPGMAHQAYNKYRKLSSPAPAKAQGKDRNVGSRDSSARNRQVTRKTTAAAKIPGLPPAFNIKQAPAKPRRQAAPPNPYQGKQKWWTLDPAKTNR
ncbi:MAG: tetratricopeptide repeat protein [bacterium]